MANNINDLPDQKVKNPARLFADDTAIYFGLEKQYGDLTRRLRKPREMGKLWDMSFNMSFK